MNNYVIKYSKEVSDFIEAAFSKSGEWYWSQQYYKKVGENLFEISLFKDNEDGLKHIVEQSEPREESEYGKSEEDNNKAVL